MKKQINTLKGLALMGVLMLSTTSTFAQDAPAEEKKSETKIGGYLDAYYKADFANRKDNGYTSFTSGTVNSVELGMASLYAEHKFNKASVFIDLGFGKRAEEFSYATPGTGVLIKQAYLSLEAMEGLKFTMGTWATHIGVELVNAYDNRNYSMSYAFSYGPFSNTGVKADYVYDKFNFMVGLSQPTDYRTALNSGGAGTTQKTVIGQVGYAMEGTSVYLNGTVGSRNPLALNETQIDLVFNQKITDEFSGTLNGSYKVATLDGVSGDKKFFTTVAYLKYDVSDKYKVTYRGEYFDDKDGLATFSGVGASVFSNTLSLNYIAGNLIVTPEIRFDSASKEVFMDADGKGTKTNGYFILGTAYKF